MRKPTPELSDLIAQHAGPLALSVNEPLVNLMVVGRQLCGDDLDAFLVLMVVIQQANRHSDFPTIKAKDLVDGKVAEIPSVDMNIQSIADYTGIPKETARRKVLALVDRGWVERDGGSLRFTAKGYLGVTPGREAAVKLAASIVHAVDRYR